MKHMLNDNICLIVPRQTTTNNWSHVQASDHLSDNRIQYSNKGIPIVCPLYLFPDKNGQDAKRSPNLNDDIIKQIAKRLHLAFRGEKSSNMDDFAFAFSPIDILRYIYAILHSPAYREKYKEYLKIGFPRVPIPSVKMFRSLSTIGAELIELHLMKSSKFIKHITEWQGDTPSAYISRVTYKNSIVYIDAAQTQGFCGVPNVVWSFHVGGYQVCAKWLKDRKGLRLSAEDIVRYQEIVVTLSETSRVMIEIDETINQNGGWPLAFQVLD